MKKISFIMLLIGLSAMSFAQPEYDRDDAPNRGEVRAMRVAFITTQMQLTPEESEKFWPIANQFDAKKQELKKPLKEKERALREKGIDNASDEEIVAMMNAHINFKAAMLELEKEYQKKYLSVLPAKKVAKFYMSEERFRKHLLRKMKEDGNEPEMRRRKEAR